MSQRLPFPVMSEEAARAQGFRPVFEYPEKYQHRISDDPLPEFDGIVKPNITDERSEVVFEIDAANNEAEKITTKWHNQNGSSTFQLRMTEDLDTQWN